LFSFSFVAWKENADERIFLRTHKRRRKIYDTPTHQFTHPPSSKQEHNSKDKGFTSGHHFQLIAKQGS
jgi:hypothetical protein